MSTVAQKFSIQGEVSDSTGAWLPSATVMLLNPADSSLVNFTVTNEQGHFEFKNVATNYISAEGHIRWIQDLFKRHSARRISADIGFGNIEACRPLKPCSTKSLYLKKYPLS